MDSDPTEDPRAELHYITEQRARHARIWESHTDPPTPNCKDQWRSVPLKIRDQEFGERVRFLESLNLEREGLTGAEYEGFIFRLYKMVYGGMEEGAVLRALFIPLDEFKTQVTQFDLKELVKAGEALSLEDIHDASDGNDLDEGIPVDDIQDQNDPIILALEATAAKGASTLEDLLIVFGNSNIYMGETDWKKEISSTLKFSDTAKVIIGVVGSTGAGKSSLINAIVDEEKILATNCMRASTAVATEISYNHGEFKYAAKIEFIQRDEWERELQILFRDLEDCRDDVLRNDVQKDSEAAVALNKIKAVYPNLSPKDILNSSIDKLMWHPAVGEKLGSTLLLEENDPKVFSNKLRKYTDSQTKRRGPKSKKKPEENNMAIWPLISVVKIYVKATALSTGAVLVDLPGVFDSNAARVAVAQGYMKRCSAHWVIAPINRAVDDKVAQDLLGQNFKMQMSMDDAFNDITFVCTKTDDISVSEVQDSFKLDLPSLEESRERDIKCKALERSLQHLRFMRNHVTEELEHVRDEQDFLEESQAQTQINLNDLSDISPFKRKRTSDVSVLTAGSGTQGSAPEMVRSESDGDLRMRGTTPTTPSKEEVEDKMQRLKMQKSELASQRKLLSQQIQAKEDEIERLNQEAVGEEKRILQECIDARNGYSKQEIKRDFARGIRELDAEFVEDEEDGEGRVDLPARDYKELEDGLPVFCVSTRAYQKLRGRLRKETNVAGFSSLEETEIPQLQRHCITLTDKARKASAMRFLIRLSQVMQSLHLWSLATSPANILTDEKKQEMEAGLNEAVANLTKAVENLKDGLFVELREAFETNILRRLDTAARHGSDQCLRVIARWNAPPNQGGVRFNTYRAICRRNGFFRTLDWNQELANPTRDRIVAGWNRCFNVSVPMLMKAFGEDLQRLMRQFHEDAIASADETLSAQSKERLDAILKPYCSSIEQQMKQTQLDMQQSQKDTNRAFAEVIERELKNMYLACSQQTGTGSLRRMQNLVVRETNENRTHMFNLSVQNIRDQLQELVEVTEKVLQEALDVLLGHLARDYHVGIIAPQIRKLSDDQIRVKNEVSRIIQKAEKELKLGEILEKNEVRGHGQIEQIGGQEQVGQNKEQMKTEEEVMIKEEPIEQT